MKITPCLPVIVLFVTILSGCTSQRQKNTSLYQTAVVGDLTGARRFLSEGAGVDSANEQGWTPLMEASGSGHSDVVMLLLDNHADVNYAAPKNGFTALHVAAKSNRPAVIKILLSHGAKTELRDKKGSRPLDIARQIRGHYTRSLNYMPPGREYRDSITSVSLLEKAGQFVSVSGRGAFVPDRGTVTGSP